MAEMAEITLPTKFQGDRSRNERQWHFKGKINHFWETHVEVKTWFLKELTADFGSLTQDNCLK